MARQTTQARAGVGARTGAAPLQWILVVVGVALAGTVVAAVQHRRGVLEHAAAAARETAAAAQAVDQVPAPDADGPTAVPVDVMNDLTSIPAETWTKAGTAGARAPVYVDVGNPGAKPVVLYIGAGFCPYCAAARWSMITSLARFGTFSGLTYAASSSIDVFPSTPTFSFYGAHYASRYVDFQTVELAGEEPGLDGRYPPLEKPTPEQEALLRKYDAPPYVDARSAGGIPFILVGGRYMFGTPFSPQVLAKRTQADIAATLPTANGLAAQWILVNANVLTASICAVNGNQPAAVCSDPMIQRAIASLPGKPPA